MSRKTIFFCLTLLFIITNYVQCDCRDDNSCSDNSASAIVAYVFLGLFFFFMMICVFWYFWVDDVQRYNGNYMFIKKTPTKQNTSNNFIEPESELERLKNENKELREQLKVI